jgi:hypothetical protein
VDNKQNCKKLSSLQRMHCWAFDHRAGAFSRSTWKALVKGPDVLRKKNWAPTPIALQGRWLL